MVAVRPQYRSSTCLKCGYGESESRIDRVPFQCVLFGRAANGDLIAATQNRRQGMPFSPEGGVSPGAVGAAAEALRAGFVSL